MSKYLFFLFLFFLSSNCFSQGWVKQYGGIASEYGEDIIATSDGGYLAVGYTTSFGSGNGDMYIVKTDSLGLLLWQRAVGDAGVDLANASVESPTGDFYIAGKNGDNDILIVKINTTGNIVWTKTFGGVGTDVATGIVDAGNDIVVAGTTSSFGQGSNDIYLFKIDSAGTMIWEKTIGSIVSESCYDLIKVHDGGFLVCGSYTTASFTGAYAARTDAQGDSIWSKIYPIGPAGYTQYSSCIELEGDSVFVMAGRGGSGYSTYYATGFDLDGNIIYPFTQSGYLRYVTDIAKTNDGGFVALGYPFTKFSHDLKIEWETSALNGNSVIQNSDNSFILCGGYYGADSVLNYDLALFKTSPEGYFPLTAAIPVQVNGTTQICSGQTRELYVPDGFDQYQWHRYTGNYTTVALPMSNNDTIVVDTLGNYYCMMRLGNEIFKSQTISLGYIITPFNELNFTDSLSYCSLDTSISIITNTIANSSYQWFLDGVQISGATSASYEPTQAGDYYVVTANTCGTSTSDTITVKTNSPPIINISPVADSVDFYTAGNISCGFATITVEPSPSQSYLWIANGNPTGVQSNYIDATEPGIYYCIVTNSCGTNNSFPVTIIGDTLNITTTPIVNGPLTGCGTFNTSFSVTNDQTYTYKWFKNGLPLSFGTGYSYSPNTTGVYQCLINRVCEGDTVKVWSDSIFYDYDRRYRTNVAFSGTFPVICGDSIILSINQTFNATYQWFRDSILLPGADNYNYTAFVTGMYYCETYIPGCDPVGSYSKFIRVGLPVASIIAEDTVVCNSNSIEFSLETNDYISNNIGTANWSKDGISINGATYGSYYTNQPGVYNCTVANICGSIVTNSITLYPSVPTVSITSSSGANFCFGDTIELAATYFPNYTYEWYNSNDFTGDTTAVIFTTEPGYYYVRYHDGNCLKQTLPFTLITDVFPSTSILPSGYPQICQNDSVQLFAPNRSDCTYQWFKNGLILPGETSENYYASTTGDYNVMVFDSIGCEFYSPTQTIGTSTIGNFSIYTSSGNNVACNGDTITLYAGINGSAYQWYFNNDPISGETNNTLQANLSGLYSVFVSDGAGCSGVSSIEILERSQMIYYSSVPDHCSNSTGSITIYQTNLIYEWSTGDTGPMASNLAAGNYTVTVTDFFSCSVTESIVLANTDTLPVFISGDTTLCAGQQTYLNAGNNFNSYLWSTNDTVQYIYTNIPGTYSVTVSDIFGCTGSDSIVIAANPVPLSLMTPTGPIAFCRGDSVLLSMNQGMVQYSWFRNSTWIQGSNASSYMAKSNGLYTCDVRDANGCTKTSNAIYVSHSCIPILDEHEKFQVSNDEEFSFVVYPNPSSGEIFIDATKFSTENISIQLYDYSGRKINYNLEKSHGGLYKIMNLPGGVYIVSLKSSQKYLTGKIVVLH